MVGSGAEPARPRRVGERAWLADCGTAAGAPSREARDQAGSLAMAGLYPLALGARRATRVDGLSRVELERADRSSGRDQARIERGDAQVQGKLFSGTCARLLPWTRSKSPCGWGSRRWSALR